MNLFKKKIFNIIFLSFSILLFFFVFNKSKIVWDGNRFDIYFQYYVLSLFLILLCICSFFLKKNINNKFYLVLISIVIFIYLIEILLITYSNYNQKIDLEKEPKYQVYKKLNSKENVSIVFNHKRYFDENSTYYFLGGKSKVKNLDCNENGYYSFFYTDRYGFQNDDNLWDEALLDKVFIGDSFGLSSCVNKVDTIVENLKKKNNQLKIINLSWGGNGPLSSYASLIEYGSDKSFKKLIWFFFENDFENLNQEKKNRILKKYVEDEFFTQNLKKKQFQINSLIDSLHKKAEENLLISGQHKKKRNIIGFLKLQKIRSFVAYTGKIQYDLDLLEKIFKKTKNYADKNNIELTIIYLPDFYETKTNKDSPKKIILFSILDELNIEYLDFFESVKKIKNPLSIFPNERWGHYNEKGYKLLSEFIFDNFE